MKMTHAVAALMLAGAFALPVAAQTTPATPGKDAVKAERDKARADQQAVRQDTAAIKADRDQIKTDTNAGPKEAVTADREK